jgi:hypothetical protein
MFKSFFEWLAPPTKGWPMKDDPRIPNWKKKWMKYVEEQTKIFSKAGCVYPRTGQEYITEVVATAIMEKTT